MADFYLILFWTMVISLITCIICIICLSMLRDRRLKEKAKTDNMLGGQEWRDSVTDKRLEEELEEYILSPERREELRDEIRSANVKIPGITNSENIPLLSSEVGSDSSNLADDEKRRIAADNRRQVLRVLMALRGKLLVEDVENGVEFKQRDTDIYSMKPSDFAKQAEENANFMLWVQRQLEKQGRKSSLCVKSGGNVYSVYENKKFNGKYVWAANKNEQIFNKDRSRLSREEVGSILKTAQKRFLDSSLLHKIVWFLFKVSGVIYLGSVVIELILIVFD